MAVELKTAILNLQPEHWLRRPDTGATMTSEATPDTGTDTETTVTVETDTDATDWRAEAEKWKTQARKHEDRAKANANAAKELEEARRQGMTELEATADKARAEGRAEAVSEYGTKLVRAEVRAAAVGRVADVDALLEGVDGSKFLDADGEPDIDAITKWVDRIAPAPEAEPEPGFPDLGQGARTQDQRALNGDPLLRDIKSKLGIR
jgi:hypothetical protein